jgi:hypothetical protein
MYGQPAPEHPDVVTLKNLGIGFYVIGGLMAFSSILSIVYMAVAGVFMGAAGASSSGPGAQEAAILGGVFLAVAVVMVLLLAGWGALLYVAGKSLRSQRRYTFCIVVAALICLHMPLGTILGIWTIVYLSKPHVKAIFT